MNKELQDAIDQWEANPIIRSEWDATLASPACRAAFRIERLRILSEIEKADKGVHSQIADRTLFMLKGALQSLNNLESCTTPPSERPKPLPKPWSCWATENQTSPDK